MSQDEIIRSLDLADGLLKAIPDDPPLWSVRVTPDGSDPPYICSDDIPEQVLARRSSIDIIPKITKDTDDWKPSWIAIGCSVGSSDKERNDAFRSFQSKSATFLRIILELPEKLLQRLNLSAEFFDNPSTWLEVLFHLGHHFPSHFNNGSASPFRVIKYQGDMEILYVQDLLLNNYGIWSRPMYPGLIFAELSDGLDLKIASQCALKLIREIVLGTRERAPDWLPQLTSLREEFGQAAELAQRSGSEFLSARVIRLNPRATVQPAECWRQEATGTLVRSVFGGSNENKTYLLSTYFDLQEVLVLSGQSLPFFLELADRAGALLPKFPKHPYPPISPHLLNDVVKTENLHPSKRSPTSEAVGVDPWGHLIQCLTTQSSADKRVVTDHRGNIERWLGALLTGLKGHDRPNFHEVFRFPKDGPPHDRCALRLDLDKWDAFSASVTLIDSFLPIKNPDVEPPMHDGFDEHGKFWYQNKPVDFGRALKRKALVKSLWDDKLHKPRPRRQVEDVLGEIYGHDNDTSDSTFKVLCSNTNTKSFEPLSLALRIRVSEGFVELRLE